MAEFALSVIGKIEDYQRKIAQIPGMTDKAAAQASAALVRHMNASQARAARSVTQAVQETQAGVARMAGSTSSGLANLANQAADVAVQLEQGQPIGRIMLQQGTQVADAVRMMGISFGALLRVVAPIGLAVGALALAYDHLNDELKESEERAAKAAAESEALATALGKVRDAQRDLDDQLALESGSVTKAQLAQRDAVERVRGEYDALIGTQRGVVDGIQKEIAATAQRYEQYREQTGQDELRVDLAEELRVKTEALTTALGRESTQLDHLNRGRDRAITEAVNTIQATENVTKATKAAADADREAREAAERLRKERAAMVEETFRLSQAEIERREAVEEAIRSLAEQTETSARKRLGAEERVTAELEDQLSAIRAQEAGALVAASSAEAVRLREAALAAEVEAETTAAEQIREIRDRAAAEEAKRSEEASRRQQESALLAVRYAADGAGALAKIAGDSYTLRADYVQRLEETALRSEAYLTDEQRAALEERTEAAKSAARRAFRAQQAAAAVQAAINTALAVSEALASAPPPYNAIPAGVALATGLAQEVAIATQEPPFHRGGTKPPGGLGDEVLHRVLPGEAVVSRQGMRTERDVRDSNAGVGSRRGRDPVLLVYDRRIIGQAAADDIRAGGRLYESLSTRGIPYGHTR